MTFVLRRRSVLAAAWLVVLAACQGDGSDIGPSLPRLPDASSKVILFDDANRGVVSATVSLVGGSASARTGRNGRGDFLASPRGRRLFDVDPSWSAATAGDTLGGYRVALTVTGPDAPTPLHVPDLPDAASAVVSAGLQAGVTTVTSAHGVLTVTAGVVVSLDGAEATARLALGELAAQHLPGDLPASGVGTRLFGRGFYVGPLGASFSPGLDLDVEDDLEVTVPNAELFWLNDQTGEWEPVGVASASADRLEVLGAVTRGGLYALGVVVSDVRTVEGRVVDVAGLPVPDAMVTIDQRHTTTAADGTFSVPDVAATFGDGSLRPAQLEVYAGGSWLPAVETREVPGASTAVTVVDVVELDTLPAGNVRVQQILRARADAFQPARLSTLLGEVAVSTAGDSNGQAFFEDVPAGYFGYQEARRRNRADCYYGQNVSFMGVGRRWLDSNQFLFERRWHQQTNSTRGYVCDRIGGGPVDLAAVVEGQEAGAGLADITTETGESFVGRGFGGRATATLRTVHGDEALIHGFTVQSPDAGHQEFPMRRVRRPALGRFDRHGYVTGAVSGWTQASSYETRVSRRMTHQELWDAVYSGDAALPEFPVDLGVGSTAPNFRVGLPVAGGNIAIAEYVERNGEKQLVKAAVLADVREGLVEGAELQLGGPAPLVDATTSFVLQDALLAAPADVDVGGLTLSLGQSVPGAGVVDVARDMDASLTPAGDDLELFLPTLSAGEQWLLLLGGQVVDGGVTSSHFSMVEVGSDPTTDFVFQAFPEVTLPVPGPSGSAEVAAAGFDVSFALPAGAVGGKLELLSEGSSSEDRLMWEVLVPPTATEFRFVDLPAEAETPLLPNRTYTLTVSAWFGDVSIDSPNVYGDFVAFAQSVAPVEAGVRQVTSRSIVIDTL